MSNPSFTHLHVHSDASKDGLRPVEALVSAAKQAGFSALALTDHGTLANAVSFTINCHNQGIKPILGVEGYVNLEGKIGHITLLADGEQGFHSLVQLQNIAHLYEGQTRPAFTFQDLLDHQKGVICLSGCVSSPMNSLDYPDARGIAIRLKNVFGGRLYAEVMTVNENPELWERPIKLAQDLGLKLVQTNDAHFPYAHDAEVHQVLTAVRVGFTYHSEQLWLKSTQEMVNRNSLLGLDMSMAMQRAFDISQRIKEVPLARVQTLPTIKDATMNLRNLVMTALAKLGHHDDEYTERVAYELSVIEKMGYSTYFLILYDIIKNARKIGARVGPGRGSGAGSLVLYLLNVTEMDPIIHSLNFERFLTEFRVGMPDVDIDFDSEMRPKVLEYAAKRWKAVPIATYSRYTHKSLIHSLAKYFKTSRDDEALVAENGLTDPAYQRILAETPLFGRAYEAMVGQVNHRGKHAGGVVITDADVPMERADAETIVASWTEGQHNELSWAGIVKFDLLSLSALTVLNRLEKRYGRRAEDPVDNSPVFSIFTDTDLVGIFQFSGSSGIMDLIRRVNPTSFEDLAATSALYRPGALDAGTADKYPKFRKSPRKIHPKIDPLLETTYGVIIYQEQVMAIFQTVVNGTLVEADVARSVIVKSKAGDPVWEQKILKLEQEFYDKGKLNGFDQTILKMLWSELQTHARYSFNRAHAISYARISWDLAWWRYYYSTSFYAELLNADPTEMKTILISAISNGIQVEMPNVVKSSSQYEDDGTTLFLPLDSVKFLGRSGADAIIEARTIKPFVSVADFAERVPKKKCSARGKRGLYALGAFSDLVGTYTDLMGKKDDQEEEMSDYEAQQQFLGFALPTFETLSRLDEMKKQGIFGGIIVSSEAKSSKHGPYTVYKLMPEGSCWGRGGGFENFKPGQLIIYKKNAKTGRILSAKVLKDG